MVAPLDSLSGHAGVSSTSKCISETAETIGIISTSWENKRKRNKFMHDKNGEYEKEQLKDDKKKESNAWQPQWRRKIILKKRE